MNTFIKMVPQFYYECDWNGPRIIVIVQQTKKWFVWKKKYYEDFANFATCRFSTLNIISYCLEYIVSHKKY